MPCCAYWNLPFATTFFELGERRPNEDLFGHIVLFFQNDASSYCWGLQETMLKVAEKLLDYLMEHNCYADEVVTEHSWREPANFVFFCGKFTFISQKDGIDGCSDSQQLILSFRKQKLKKLSNSFWDLIGFAGAI